MANTFKFGNGNWAVKKDSVLAYNDENNNFKPLPFDFTRDTIGTYVDSDGLIKTASNNEARIDYLDNADGHLLLEPSRTNLIQQSNKFDTYWTLDNITVASGQTGVGGNTEAWKITASSGSVEKKLNINLLVSGNHAISIYAKKGTKDYVWLRGVTSSTNKRVFFNLANGTIETDEAVSSNIIDMGDGWYRCEAVFNQQSGFEFFFGIADSDNTPAYTDDGTGTIYVQYAQAEAASYATSYIPTNGSSVTRAAESNSQTPVSGIIGQTEGTFYAEIKANETSNASGRRTISLSDGTNNNRVYISFDDEYNKLNIFIVAGTTEITVDNISISDQNTFNKVAVKYKSGDTAIYVNGVLKNSFNDTFSGSAFTTLKFQNRGAGELFNGQCKDLRVYDTALTDAELITLTT